MTPASAALALVDELVAMRRLTSVEADVLRSGLANPRCAPKPLMSEHPLSLCQRRVAKGLTQGALAIRAGLSLSGYQKLERNERRLTVVHCERLASSLGAAPLDIFSSHSAAVSFCLATDPVEPA